MSDRYDAEAMSGGMPCPSELLWDRLARRIGAETGVRPRPAPTQQWSEPEWEEVAPGISRKCFAVDAQNDRRSLLVRLAPAAHYPPCMQEAIEELYLLDGELWINGRKCYAGEYNRTGPGDARSHMWSEAGCTCFLIAIFSRVAVRRSDRRWRRVKPGAIRPLRRTNRRPRAQEE